jgi:uncharacterized protein with NRDE domain
VQSESPRRYNPFNLFVADAGEAYAVTCRGEARGLRLEPGAHVIGNAALDAPPTPKVARLREHAERVVGTPLPGALASLAELCRAHRDDDPLASACVHAQSYGTRSSALLAIADCEADSVLRYADGAPCQNEYDDFTPLLHELARGARGGEGESVARNPS